MASLNNKLQNTGSGAGIFSDEEVPSAGFQRFDQFMNPDVVKDRQVQQLRSNFQELSTELESHREKLDRILSYWEEELELDSKDVESVTDSLSASRSSRLFLRRTRTRNMDKN